MSTIGTNTVTSVNAERSQVKKARKNPARRKAERAKSEAQILGAGDKTPREAVPIPKIQRSQSEQRIGKVNVTPQRPSLSPRLPSSPTATPVQEKPTPSSPRPNSNKTTVALAAPALVTGGLLGCAAGAAMLASAGIWHGYAGADSAILAVRAAKLCLDNLADETMISLKAGTYSTEEALDLLRRTTLGYAGTIPGGAAYVERIFCELNLIRTLRGAEVDSVLSRSYSELQNAAKRGATPDQMRSIVIQQLAKLSSVVATSTRDVVDRNPSVKPLRDGAAKALEGSPPSKVPTMKVNLTVRQKAKG